MNLFTLSACNILWCVSQETNFFLSITGITPEQRIFLPEASKEYLHYFNSKHFWKRAALTLTSYMVIQNLEKQFILVIF